MNRAQAQKNFRREMRRMHSDKPAFKVTLAANELEETVWMLRERGSDPATVLPSLADAIRAWERGLMSPIY